MTSLPVIYDGVRQPEIDIVSIPGLPTLHPQYKFKEHNAWLREVLSHRIPKARIMSFLYDFGNNGTDLSWGDLLGQAVQDLLYALVNRREDASSRPIIFVCYTFGAIILKKALLVAKQRLDFNSILNRTGGIVFLGGLHNERDPSVQNLALKCAAVEFGTHLKHEAIDALRKSESWALVKETMESFRYLQYPFPVRIFYELEVTNVPNGGWTIKKNKPEVLCSEPLSKLGWPDERLIGVGRDHAHILHYPWRGDDDDFFPVLMRTLTELTDFVCADQDGPDAASHSQSSPAEDDESWSLLVKSLGATEINLEHLRGYALPMSSPTSGLAIEEFKCFYLASYQENPSFVGREDVLDAIYKTLRPSYQDGNRKQSTFVLSGLGGMGKTQIAIKYAFRHRDIYHTVLWAQADGQAKLAESFSLFAEALGLGRLLSPTKAKTAVKDCLTSLQKPWLMIFDNADGDQSADLLREFWPQGDSGSILITSRNHTLVNQFSGLTLHELDKENAVDLLFKLTSLNRAGMPADAVQEEREAAEKIVNRLSFLPLGISQAARLITHDSCPMVEFLDAYSLQELITDGEEVQLVNPTGTAPYRYSLSTVWNINYDRLNDQAQTLINLISFVDPDRIQMQILRDGTTNAIDQPILNTINTAYKLNKGRSSLLKSGLVSQSQDRLELRMHRLVQASCQLRMDSEERCKTFQAAIDLIIAVWPVPNREAIHDPSLWDKQRALLPHVQSLCSNYNKSLTKGLSLLPTGTVNWQFASLLYEAGWFCFESGLLASVGDLLHTARKYSLQHLHRGGGYRILADIYGGIGACAGEINEFQSTYDNFYQEWVYVQKAVEHGELERQSIWWVFALGRMGNGLNSLQRFAEGEKYYRDMLSEWEHIPGDQKMYRSHLATCLWLQGKLEEAEAIVRAVIKDFNDTSNIRTAVSMFSLGNIRISQAKAATSLGEKERAEEIFRESLKLHLQAKELWGKVLGARHHRTADATYKVGWHFHRLRDYRRAIKFLEEAHSVFEDGQSLFRNEIARTKYKLGCAYQDIGQEQGNQLIQEAEGLRKKILSPSEWEPAQGEEDFDKIIQFWSR